MAEFMDSRQTTWYVPPPNAEDSLQFFKEEKVDGAVYNVYLKKVRYYTPDDAQDANDKGTYKQWSLEEVRIIKSGTLDRLVESLSNDSGDINSSYVNIFLATYRGFASPKQVLNLLFERYKEIGERRKMKQSAKEAHKRCIKTVLLVWLDSYPEDFREPPNFPCLSSLITFGKKYMAGTEVATRANKAILKFRKQEEPHGPISVEEIGLEFESHLELRDTMDYLAGGYFWKCTDFESIQEKCFADQLTFIDSELFKKVVPHECLGCVWSRRDKKQRKAKTVMATVDQFNAVSYRVVATVLKRPDLPYNIRAKVLEKWIDIAQELRVLKNFSSLKAIISGLQSNAIFRLNKVWAEVDREKMDLFEELADIFSEDNNRIMSRELLVLEGTAKFADPESTNTIRGYKRRQSIFNTPRRKSTFFEVPPTVQGTIPYLGTFLTDLTMVDTANPDYSESGLINFEKKRKEFEILAQIRLLQSAAQLYRIKPDRGFFEWFHNIRIYDDKESYELSCEIELATPTTPKEIKGHRKKSSLGFFSPRNPINPTNNNNKDEDSTSVITTLSNPSSAAPSDDTHSVYSNPELDHTPMLGTRPAGLRHSVSVGNFSLDGQDITISPWKSPDQRVVKVFLEVPDCHYSNHYKSIILSNSDHTKTVISNILLKFNMDQAPDEFVLFQQLEDRELHIPAKGNVFYAINSQVPEIKFIMRRKSDLERLKNRHLKGKGKRKKFSF